MNKFSVILIAVMCLVAQSCQILCDPWTVVHQAPLSMGSPGKNTPPGDLPNPGIEPRSPALQADYLLSEPHSLLSIHNSFIVEHPLSPLMLI